MKQTEEQTLEVYVKNKQDWEFEGVFSGLDEIRDYFRLTKKVVNAIFSADYDSLPIKYRRIAIHEVTRNESLISGRVNADTTEDLRN